MKKLILLFLIIPSLVFSSSWECIDRKITCNTWKMEIPEGYLVASDNSSGGSKHGYAMTFVPDSAHRWK